MVELVVCMELRKLSEVLARWAAKHARFIFSSGNSNPKRTCRYLQTPSEVYDWFIDSSQVGIHLTRKVSAVRGFCDRE